MIGVSVFLDNMFDKPKTSNITKQTYTRQTFEPIIGSELQSKELINHLMKENDTNPQAVWKSEIFGRSLDNIVQEGIQAKLAMMPENIRYKLQTTLTKVVNKGSNNMIAIVI